MSSSASNRLKIDQRRIYQLFAFVVIAVMLLIALMGVGLGLAQDRDSAAILERFPGILDFHYVPSRSWGNPLYEVLAAYLDAVGGLVLVNLASVFFTLIYALALYRIIHPDQDVRSLLTFAACILNPLVLSNSSVLMEFALYIALAMLTLVCAIDYARRQTLGALYGVLLFMGLMVLTRPDSALFAIVLTACLLVERRHEPDALRAIMVGVVSTGAVVLSAYILLNHGIGFLFTAGIMGSRSFKGRAEYAVVGLVAIYGLLGSAVLLALIGRALVRGRHSIFEGQGSAAFVDRLAVATVAVYLPRFFVLPDQLEYFSIPLIMSMIFLGRNLRSQVALGLITISLVLNSAMQVGVFDRAGGRIVFAPALNRGAVVQDWQARILIRERDTADFRNYVARSVYGDAEPPPVLHAEFYLDGFTSDTGDLIVGSKSAYQIDDPDLVGSPRFRSSSYRHIYVCDEEVAPRQAWRVLQPAPSLGALKRFESLQPLSCKVRAAGSINAASDVFGNPADKNRER